MDTGIAVSNQIAVQILGNEYYYNYYYMTSKSRVTIFREQDLGGYTL